MLWKRLVFVMFYYIILCYINDIILYYLYDVIFLMLYYIIILFLLSFFSFSFFSFFNSFLFSLPPPPPQQKITQNIKQQIPTHLHISGYYCIPSLQPLLPSFLSRLRSLRPSVSSFSISLDANYDEKEEWEGLKELLPLVDIFTPNGLLKSIIYIHNL